MPVGTPLLANPDVRKSFLGGALNLPVAELLTGTIAANALAVVRGAAVVRVHDVAEAVQTVRVAATLTDAQSD